MPFTLRSTAVWFGIVLGAASSAHAQSPTPASSAARPYRAVLDKYCVTCHNDRLRTAKLAFDKMDLAHVGANAEVWEKVALKLRTRTMPPARSPRPDAATYDAMASWLEATLDREAAERPNPGVPTLRRLNRVEYTNTIRDLLALEIDGASMLPADDSGYGFDNNGDVLSVSPLLMERYMIAAQKISRLAIGDPTYMPGMDTYRMSRHTWQVERMSEDLPFRSRGGAAIRRYFSQDGEYVVRIRLQKARTTRNEIRGIYRTETIEVRLDTELVRTFTIGGAASQEDRNDPERQRAREIYEESADDALVAVFPVKAGTHTVGVSIVKASAALYEGVGPERYPVESAANYADVSNLMQVDTIQIGLQRPAGAGDTPSRRKIFVCRPATTAAEESCARTILSSLARLAYRRPATEVELAALTGFYGQARRTADFDTAIGAGIERLLVSPEFLFRIERDPESAALRQDKTSSGQPAARRQN
jgi:mono/diheme cytochrome c family protein